MFFFAEVALITSVVRLICWFRIKDVEHYLHHMHEIKLSLRESTVSEQKTRSIEAVFDELDPEADGYITIATGTLAELGRMCGLTSLESAIKVRNTVHYIDPNGTGRIKKPAWVRFVAISLRSELQEEEAKREERAKKAPCGTRFAIWVCGVFAKVNEGTEGLIPVVPETPDDWEKVKDHAIQIFLMLMMMAYITLAKWGISVFDCFEQPNKPGTYFLDDAPYIECYTSEWYMLCALGGFAVTIYVIGLPILITYIFFSNYVRVRMGDMQCMQRYGFLYKPYRPGSPGWEVVILVRKSLLVLVTKLRSQSPYMQACWSLFIYAGVMMLQASVSPYRQKRHTNMANYFLGVNALAVFSSLIFTSNIPTDAQQQTLLHVNLFAMVAGWGYACYETAIDMYLYLRLQMYVGFAMKNNQVDPHVERHYQEVDINGVIDLSFYDLLVLRARYSHSITRTRTVVAEGEGEGGSTDRQGGARLSKGPASTASDRLLQTLLHQEQVMEQVMEDQTKAHKRFSDFNSHFADFIRRVDPSAVLPKVGRSGQHASSGERIIPEKDGDGQRENLSSASSHNLVGGDDEGTDDDDGTALKSPLQSPFMLTKFSSRSKMLEELYSKEILALMVSYYDFIIKHDLVKATGLDEFGAPDLAEDVIHFLNTFTTDAILHAGGRPWGRDKDDRDTLRSSQMPKEDEQQQREDDM